MFSAPVTAPEDVGQFVEAVTIGDQEIPEADFSPLKVTEPGRGPELTFLEGTPPDESKFRDLVGLE